MTAAADPGLVRVLLCINRAYAQHAAVCLVSLLENNPHLRFDVAIVSTEALDGEAARLTRSIAPYANCGLRLQRFDASADIDLPIRVHYTIDTYSRLWVGSFFPPDAAKVIYLDSDMVVTGRIDELWQTDIGDHVLAAATIPGSDRCAVYGVPEAFGYFNAGVMLINLDCWRQEQVLARCLSYIAENSEKIFDADQDALNACLYDRRQPLPYIWNVISPFFFDYHPLGLSADELRRVREDARIIHFNGVSKPWSYMSRHPRRAEYWKYLKLTEWADYRPGDKSAINWAKKHVGPLMPRRLRGYLKGFVDG
jgi:lipopolysaccharide biosynthesis glycosyltransferase